MQRRDFMSAVAALAGTRLDEAESDIENVEEWGPIDGTYLLESFSPTAVNANGNGAVASWFLEDHELDNRVAEVFYNESGVLLAFEGAADGQDVRAGTRAEFEPEQAKEIAATLYQVAEELQRRREASNGDQ